MMVMVLMLVVETTSAGDYNNSKWVQPGSTTKGPFNPAWMLFFFLTTDPEQRPRFVGGT